MIRSTDSDSDRFANPLRMGIPMNVVVGAIALLTLPPIRPLVR